MSKTTSQIEKLLRRLSTGRRLTSSEALVRYGVQRLSARIYDIKNNFGIRVATNRVTTNSTKVAYQLDETNARRAASVLNSLTA